MQDASTSAARRFRVRQAAWALGLAASCWHGAAAAQPAQELAGPARRAQGRTATVQSAMAEHRDDALPAIVFPAGSARLTPSATRILDGFTGQLAGSRIRVEAHGSGDRDLAARRGKAVAAYLAENCGLDAARVQIVVAAKGDRSLLAVEQGE